MSTARFQLPTLVSLVSLALAAGSARADEGSAPAPDTSSVELPPVVVPVPPPESRPAAHSPERRDASGAITVVQPGDAAGHAREAVTEHLSAVPGATVQDSGGFGQAKTLSLRGAPPNGVLVLLDGLPLNGGAGAGGVDLSRVPPAFLERLEILRGAAGARYGHGGLGGAVSLVTRAPTEKPTALAQLSAGSFSTWLGQLGASGPLWETQAGKSRGLVLLHGGTSRGDFPFFFANSDGSTTAGVRTNNDARQGSALVKLQQPLPHQLSFSAQAEASAEVRGLAGTVFNPGLDDRQASQRGTFSARLERAFDSGGELSLLAFGRRDALRLSGGLFDPPLSQLDGAAGGELSGSLPVGSAQRLTFVAEGAFERLSDNRGNSPSWGRFAALAMDELLLFDGTDFPLALDGSLRVDRTGPFLGFSPKVGAALGLPAGFSVRANAGQSHRAPSFLELYARQGSLLPNPELRPERALYGDVTAAWSHARGSLSAGGFYALYEDLISYELYPPFLARPLNFYAAHVYGLELAGEWRPGEWLSASANYTLQHSENLKDIPRYFLQELPHQPRHKLYAQLSVGPERLRARLDGSFQSKSYQNRAHSVELPERLLLGAALTAQPWKSPTVTVTAEVKNALDARSWDFDGYPLPSRAFFLTVGVAHP